MKNQEELKRLISVAFGREKPDTIFTDCYVLNVFTNELEKKDVAVADGHIAGLGDYSGLYRAEGALAGLDVAEPAALEVADGVELVDLEGAVICPGLIDGHIHIESSMLTPKEFAKAVIPHGTTAVITDPHEIANVAGISGIEFMLEDSGSLPIDINFVLPSCVPATPLDEAGDCLNASELEPLLKRERVVGLAELMNAFGTVRNDEEIIKKIMITKRADKVIDGHAPALTGTELNAYVAAGVTSDHECSTAEEAIEKLRLGQWIMIREGTAARNLEKLMPLFDDRYYSRCLLVTDDKHPGDLISMGHIDYIVREAIRRGADPAKAVRMASLNAAERFGLKEKGAVAPGYRADFIVVDSLESFNVKQVYYNGVKVAENGRMTASEAGINQEKMNAAGTESDMSGSPDMNRFSRVFDSFNVKQLNEKDFELVPTGSKRRVIGLIPGEILTEELILEADTSKDTEKGIVKVALIERHKNTGHIGKGYLSGYGLKKGAVASSIGHDSHNLITAGTSDADMALAANTVIANRGGLAVVCDGRVLGSLALPVGGLMCECSAEEVEKKLEELKALTRELGVAEGIDAFMTLSFASLPVIPSLRITTFGLADVATQSIVPVFF